MTDRHDDAVDVFLADLGAAPMPDDVAANAMRRVRDERPPRASRVPAWFAAAAVLVAAVLALAALGSIVAGPGPAPTPVPSTAPMATTAPSAGTTPSPSPISSPTVQPPAEVTYFEVDLVAEGTTPVLGISLIVGDTSGKVRSVVPWRGQHPSAGNPYNLAFGPGRDGSSLVVAWVGGACHYRARLDLAGDGATLALRFPDPIGCDAIGIGYAVEVRFSGPIDVATFTGRWSEDLLTRADVASPTGVAFIDWQHGFTAWRTEPGDAVILATNDGGATWDLAGLGVGTVTAIAVTGDGRAWAGVRCDSALQGCFPGRYRYDYDDGGWVRVDLAWPVALSFAADRGAALVVSADSPVDGSGIQVPDLRLTEDGGETWTTIASPCPSTLRRQDVSRVDSSTIVVLCEADNTDRISLKEIHRSTDGGRTWSKPTYAPYEGTGMHMDLVADGTGWMWGTGSPLLATVDAGLSWSVPDVAEGDPRSVLVADAWGLGAGVRLVTDQERFVLNLVSTDGAQAELDAFPIPCCGG